MQFKNITDRKIMEIPVMSIASPLYVQCDQCVITGDNSQ